MADEGGWKEFCRKVANSANYLPPADESTPRCHGPRIFSRKISGNETNYGEITENSASPIKSGGEELPENSLCRSSVTARSGSERPAERFGTHIAKPCGLKFFRRRKKRLIEDQEIEMTTCTEEPAEVGKPNGRIKISIVDDDENYRTLMKHAVDRSHDFECVGSFGGGLEALKGIRSSASDVVLMDVRMPDMPGTECARQLKSIQPHLPIIIISGFDDPHTLAKSMDAGADGFWAKRHPLAPFFGSLAVWLRRRTFGLNETSCPEKFLLVQTKVEASTATVSLPPSSDQFPESTIDGQKTSAEPEVDVASHLPTFRKALQRMVAGLEGNFHARQDLLQEALVYFWSRERQYPGRSGSWYMQGAKFYLQNLRTSGRSLNSTKRRSAQASLPDRCDEWDHWLDTLIFDEGIMSEVQARDLFSLLAGRLKPTDQTILRALDHGLGVCDIAAELKVSHVFVVKRRRLIAKLAIKLGISPLPAGPPRRA